MNRLSPKELASPGQLKKEIQTRGRGRQQQDDDRSGS